MEALKPLVFTVPQRTLRLERTRVSSTVACGGSFGEDVQHRRQRIMASSCCMYRRKRESLRRAPLARSVGGGRSSTFSSYQVEGNARGAGRVTLIPRIDRRLHHRNGVLPSQGSRQQLALGPAKWFFLAPDA